ncbi:hypothetical protein [Streptomyces sp. NRRL F-5123]|uniref:hypothetical protein n=1 Tax=Streptomyces sp. NRRL F-5123 TaxID=1463856 RepID=UPI0004E18920|nr:hypothetical protein [Streptomyces sp. NRRL F-5123]
MRTATAAVAVIVLALTAAACDGGGSYHQGAAPGTNAKAPASGAAPDPDSAAAKAIVAMVDRAEAMRSVHVVSVQQRGGKTATLAGINSWGGPDAGAVVTAAPAALGMQGMNHHDRMEMRTLDGFEYVQVDPPAAGPNKGKGWLRFTLAATMGEEVAAAMSEQMDYSPVHRLLLMPSSGPVTLIGRETVEGRPTVHYRGTVPADARIVAARKVPESAGVDVWVGADGLPVRMVSDDGKERITDVFSDFGGVVRIQQPPAAQTIVPPPPTSATA